MQLYFIRHGQSQNNALWEQDVYIESRIADPLLTEKGVRQAQLAADFLASENPELNPPWIDMQNRRSFGITHVYCSLMERAVLTGSIISERLKLPLYGVPDMHEVGGIYLSNEFDGVVSYEIMHGLNQAYLREKYPNLDLLAEIPERGWWRGGREERPVRMARAQRVVRFLKERHGGTDDHVAVITHGGFYSYLFRVFFGLDLEVQEDLGLPYQIVYNNCGISRFDITDDEVLFLYHNRTEFLPDELIT